MHAKIPKIPKIGDSVAEYQELFIVEKIIKKRYSRRGIEYLVKWLGYSDAENSWNLGRDLNCKQLIADFERDYVDSDDQLDDIEEIDGDLPKQQKPKVLKQLILDVPLQSTSKKSLKRSSNSKKAGSTKRKKKSKGQAEETLYEVEDILDSRTKDGVLEYEVKWKGYKKTSWEPEESLVECQDVVRFFEERVKKEKLTKSTSSNSVLSTLTVPDQENLQSNGDFLKAVKGKLEKMNSSESASAKKKIMKILEILT
uniref:Chromo domain-containing protein n=1 Tax=Ditylenchus dipsaci TaxID=166011 RepID=A0A915DU22_9BILA